MPEVIGLDDPSYVARLKSTWRAIPLDMIVIEYSGDGDPFFGGSADDRPLGQAGRILERNAPRCEVAVFATIDDAHQASRCIPNRRPDSRLGVAPRWR